MPEDKNKVGTQLLLSPHTRDRARVLAVIRQERMAEIYRSALEGAGLKGLERQHADEIARLHTQLSQAEHTSGVSRSSILAALSANRVRPEDRVAWFAENFGVPA